MERDILLAIFCWKLDRELGQFSRKMENRSKIEIIASAYQIDSMFMIYELLLELASAMTCEELDALNSQQELLELVYQDWLKAPDSRNEEMFRFLSAEKKWLTVQTEPVRREEEHAA